VLTTGFGVTLKPMHLPGFKPETEATEATEPEVEVRIRGLMMDPSTKMPIVVLNDLTGEVVLPIWVGLFEANAIALEIEKATTPRPMTHDLMRSLIDGLNARVTRVVVGDLRSGRRTRLPLHSGRTARSSSRSRSSSTPAAPAKAPPA
jgi:hypothetical protein